MYPRTEYEMTEADLQAILDACKPVPYMVVGGMAPRGPQENANAAWAALGAKMGFDHMTVQPMRGKGERFFTAVPSETPEVRAQRLQREADEKRQQEIAKHEAAILEHQQALAKLKEGPDANVRAVARG